jgi:hypothetical protein
VVRGGDVCVYEDLCVHVCRVCLVACAFLVGDVSGGLWFRV